MRFLIDTQLPLALADFARDQGHQTEHVLEIGLAQSKDHVLWKYAVENNAIIITKDEDFADWIARGKMGPQIVWLRIGNCSNAELLAWMTSLWPKIISRLELEERLVEIR